MKKLLLIALISFSCTQKWVPKNVKVKCPKYPEHSHYVPRNNIKMQDPGLCPAYKNPRKEGLGGLSSW